jgi:hypothetical protein
MASIRRLRARAWNSSSNFGRANAGASRETGTRLRAPKSPRRAERYPASAPLCQYRDILDPSGPASGVALSINPPHDQRKAKNIPPSGPALAKSVVRPSITASSKALRRKPIAVQLRSPRGLFDCLPVSLPSSPILCICSVRHSLPGERPTEPESPGRPAWRWWCLASSNT